MFGVRAMYAPQDRFFFEGPFPTAGTARIPILGGASGQDRFRV